MINTSNLVEKEKLFFERRWAEFDLQRKDIPFKDTFISLLPWHLNDFSDKSVLICSCGDIRHVPVFALETSAKVFFFDLSLTAVRRERQSLNKEAYSGGAVMDFHKLGFRDESFDFLYGHLVLHHIVIEPVFSEIWRVLKPGGFALFNEPFQNPILSSLRDYIYPKDEQGNRGHKGRLGFKRIGSSDENPLTKDDIKSIQAAFRGPIKIQHYEFGLFRALFNHFPNLKFIGEHIPELLERIVPRILYRFGSSIYILVQKQ